MSTLLTRAYVATMDTGGTEYPDGWIVVSDGLISEVGEGPPPAASARVSLGGALVTPASSTPITISTKR
jgi:8-oxoguanine deaminase